MATIQGVYVALFGRPADPIGLAYFNTATQNGANLSAIGDLASTQEYKDRFLNKNNTEIVNSIYKSLFNRDAEEGGLNFFVNALNTGALNINNIAIAILDGAQGSDKTIVDFKIDAAARFTASLDTPTKVAAYSGTAAITAANNFINGVTEKQTDAQIKTAVESVANGLEVVLTAAAETANSDAAGALKTSVFNDTIDATTADSWNNGDKIDAGVGTDTLNATLSKNVTVDGLTAAGGTILKSVEVLNLTANGAAVIVDLDKAEGVTTVWSKASVDNLTVSSVAKTVAFGVEGANANVAFNVKDVAGTSDALTITLKGATTTGLTAAGIEKLTLNAETASVTVAGIGGSTLVDAVVSGVGGGTYSFAASTTLKTVDVSAVTGAGASVNVADVDSGVTVTGSKFAETITLGGAGADVVVYNASNISTLTQKDVIDGFATGSDKIDLKAFGFTSGTAAVTTFGVSPIDGSGFLGNAVGKFGNLYFVDTNKDGVFNAATDLQIEITGGNAVIGDFIFA